jgi:hypothetical protein
MAAASFVVPSTPRWQARAQRVSVESMDEDVVGAHFVHLQGERAKRRLGLLVSIESSIQMVDQVWREAEAALWDEQTDGQLEAVVSPNLLVITGPRNIAPHGEAVDGGEGSASAPRRMRRGSRESCEAPSQAQSSARRAKRKSDEAFDDPWDALDEAPLQVGLVSPNLHGLFDAGENAEPIVRTRARLTSPAASSASTWGSSYSPLGQAALDRDGAAHEASAGSALHAARTARPASALPDAQRTLGSLNMMASLSQMQSHTAPPLHVTEQSQSRTAPPMRRSSLPSPISATSPPLRHERRSSLPSPAAASSASPSLRRSSLPGAVPSSAPSPTSAGSAMRVARAARSGSVSEDGARDGGTPREVRRRRSGSVGGSVDEDQIRLVRDATAAAAAMSMEVSLSAPPIRPPPQPSPPLLQPRPPSSGPPSFRSALSARTRPFSAREKAVLDSAPLQVGLVSPNLHGVLAADASQVKASAAKAAATAAADVDWGRHSRGLKHSPNLKHSSHWDKTPM